MSNNVKIFIKKYFCIPSFIILIEIILSIVIINYISEYINNFFYIIIFVTVLFTMAVIITSLLKKNNTILNYLLLFFCIMVFIIPNTNYKHIRNYYALKNNIDLIEYKIVSYPEFIKNSKSFFKFNAEICYIYLDKQKIQVFGKVRIKYDSEYLPLKRGDHILCYKLPEYDIKDSKKFYRKGIIQNKTSYLLLEIKKSDVYDFIITENIFFEIGTKIRNLIIDTFDRFFSYEIFGLSKSILIGDRGNIDPDIYELFEKNNALHLIAISGLHFGSIALIIYILLSLLPLKRKLRFILLTPIIILYYLLISNRISVNRAVLMFLLGGIAFILLERKSNTLNILYITAGLSLLFEPSILFDISFQLSFTSVFSILLIFQPINKHLYTLNKSNNKYINIIINILSILLLNIIVQLSIFPLILLNFGYFNILSVFTAVIIIPLFSIFLFSLIIFTLLSFLNYDFLNFISYFVEGLGRIFINILYKLSKLEFVINLNCNIIFILCLWLLLIVLIMFICYNIINKSKFTI